MPTGGLTSLSQKQESERRRGGSGSAITELDDVCLLKAGKIRSQLHLTKSYIVRLVLLY